MVSIAAADGLGHVVQTQLTTDPDGTDYAATIYNGLGSPYQTYNPTRCSTPTTNCGESTWGVTTTLYDALGRTCLLVPPDATPPTSNACPTTQPPDTVFTTYSGNTATVIDEAGNARESVTDALGRLKTVLEDPGSSPHLNYETDYAYTPLDDLQCVAQNNAGAFSGCTSLNASWRPRSFSYDSLSRLTSATNPESGTITYSYDANGNLVGKTSPAPNQTGAATVTASYSYDPLNRLTQKSFSDGTTPTVKFAYDATALTGCTTTPPALTDAYPTGRRTAMCDGGGAESRGHDQMGRPLAVARTTNGLSKTFPYTYNLDGSISTLTYRTEKAGYALPVTYTQSGAGRPLQLTGGGVTITANAHYTPGGDLCYRQDDWDGAWTTTKTFNNRFQPVTIQSVQMFSGTPPPVCGISPIYSGGCCTSVLDLSYSFTDASGHNNGNVQRINNNLNMERTEVFSYDSLNRLSTAETLSDNQPWYQGDDNLSNCWGEQYTYDPWGNFSAITPVSSAYTGCSQESLSMSPTTKNQLEDTNGDYLYDAAGNLTQPGPIGGPYVYDAENHLISADGVTYTYDGDGNRVMKSNGTIYWYGANSASLEESDLSGNIQRLYYFFDGQRVGRLLPTNEVGFYMTDALGNVRYLGGSATGYRFDYFPFGAPILDSDTGDDRYQFTGKERDTESGNDYFGARYYASTMGRFLSPDWSAKVEPVPYAKLDNPQSLNLYAYVLNNPLIHIDADGHIIDDSSLQKNKQYQKWKSEYLSHAGAKAQWNALNDNKTLTVHMSWDSKGSSSLTSGYQWDKSGSLTSVNVSLAAKTGDVNNQMSAAAGYIHGATITDPAQRQAYVMAHEFGHVEYAETPGGHASLVQSDKDYSFTSQMFKQMGIQHALQLPAVQQANQRLLDASQEREQGADQRAWDIVGPQQ